MLSPLQERVATIIAGLEEAEDFALAGGAALIIRGEITRHTRDLDFFGLAPEAVDRLLPAAETALRESGLDVRRIQVGPGFARLVIESQQDRTEVDLAADARLFPADARQPIRTLTGPELGADKVDRGFSPRYFAEDLGRFARLRRDEFELNDFDYDRLARSVARWRERALELAIERDREREIGKGHGIDI